MYNPRLLSVLTSEQHDGLMRILVISLALLLTARWTDAQELIQSTKN